MNPTAELSPDARAVVTHTVQIKTLEDRLKTVEDKLDRIQWTVLVAAVAALLNLAFHLK
jgi:hypothetical protein